MFDRLPDAIVCRAVRRMLLAVLALAPLSVAHAGDGICPAGATGFVLAADAPPCVPAPAGVVAWYRLEGDTSDAKGGAAGTPSGATFTEGLAGQALSFDGNDYVQIPRSIQDDFTIEFWVNTTYVGNGTNQWWNGAGLVDSDIPFANDDFGVSLGQGKVLFGTGKPDVTIRSGVIADGLWHHVAATRKRSTGALNLYVDGALVASGTGGTQSLSAATSLRIGSLQTGGPYFRGKLDEVTLYGRDLSAAEVATIHQAGAGGKCPPPECVAPPANQVLWLRAEGNPDDEAAGHVGNAWDTTYVAGKTGQAFSFDGSGAFDYVMAADAPDLRPTSFTIEAWIRVTGPEAGRDGFVVTKATNALNTSSYFIHVGTSALSAGIGNMDGHQTITWLGFNPGPDEWHHVAYAVDGVKKTQTLYLDGTELMRSEATLAIDYSSEPLVVGALVLDYPPFWPPPVDSPFHGDVDELAMYDRALTAEEIASLYRADAAGKCLGDLKPDPISFPTKLGVQAGTPVKSVLATVCGLERPVLMTLSGDGTTASSVNGGSFSKEARKVGNTDTIRMRVTAGPLSGAANATVGTVAVGSGRASFEVRTARDDTPDPYDFPDMTGVAADSNARSSVLKPGGFTVPLPVSVSGAASCRLAIDGQGFVTDGTIAPPQTLQLRVRSAAAAGGARTCTVSLGGVTDTFRVTTAP